MTHQIEQKWIEYWNDLHELIEKSPNHKLINAQNQHITLAEAQGLIQDEVYKGKDIEFKTPNPETIQINIKS